MTLSHKQNAARTGLLARTVVPETDVTAEEWNELIDRLEAVEAGSAGMYKAAVRVATTVAGTLATSFENGDTVDGVVLATGDRILIKDQAAPAENGIYVVAATGAPARATDFDLAAEVEVGALVLVEEGTTNAATVWALTTTGTVVLETTALTFERVGGPSTADVDLLTTISGRDDFDTEADLWVTIESAAGATLKQGSSLSNNGFPSSGVTVFSLDTTVGAKLMRIRPAGLALDATTPLVVEVVMTVGGGGVVADDECEWAVGVIGGELLDHSVGVVGILSPGRVHRLRTTTAGVTVTEAITLPVWTERIRIRMSITPTGTVVSAAVDGGAIATVFTSAEVPPSTIYHPLLRIAKETGAGDRVLAVDSVSWSGARDASSPGVAYDTLRTVTPMSAYLPLAGGTLTGALSTSSTIDGRDVATDGAALDGHIAAANPHSGSVPTTRTVSAGSGLTGGGDLSADRTLAVDFGESGDIAAVGRAAAAGATGEVADAGHVHDGGAVSVATADHTGTFNLANTHDVVLIDNGTGAVSIQLPTPSARRWRLHITSATKNAVSLLRAGTEKIGGRAATRILRAPHGSWVLICDGTDWYLSGKNRLDLVYTSSGSVGVEAGWVDAEVYMRAGAGGGGSGGNGGAGQTGGATGGGGGKGGGGGGHALGLRRPLTLPAAGTTITVTVGAGGAGGGAGAGATGTSGSASALMDGATELLQAGRISPASGGVGGTAGGAGAAGSAGGAAGSGGGAGGLGLPLWGGVAGASSTPGAGGGAGANGGGGTSSGVSAATRAGPWETTTGYNTTGVSGLGGAQSGGTHGGGGGGSGGGCGGIGDEFSPSGVASAAADGNGGARVTTEGNGGAANSAGNGSPGVNGPTGGNGTNGRGGGGGGGAGGGGAASGTGGTGGTGGAGGTGSDGLIVITVWE